MRQENGTNCNGVTLKRVTKPTFIKAWLAGEKVSIMPVNLRIDNCYIQPMCLTDFDENICSDETPVERVNNIIWNYEHYNCFNSETGRKVKYLLEVK